MACQPPSSLRRLQATLLLQTSLQNRLSLRSWILSVRVQRLWSRFCSIYFVVLSLTFLCLWHFLQLSPHWYLNFFICTQLVHQICIKQFEIQLAVPQLSEARCHIYNETIIEQNSYKENPKSHPLLWKQTNQTKSNLKIFLLQSLEYKCRQK